MFSSFLDLYDVEYQDKAIDTLMECGIKEILTHKTLARYLRDVGNEL
jgi:hypothetical protein